MADVITTAQAGPQITKETAEALMNMQSEIQQHQYADSKRSYLGKAFDWVYSSDEKSFKQLEEIEHRVQYHVKNGEVEALEKMRDEINQAVAKDKNALKWQSDISQLGGAGLKIGSLFFGGKIGYIASAGFFAADEAKPGDKIGAQAVDLTLGATKGVAFKFMLDKTMGTDMNIALKGGAMSIGGRALDTALTRENYYDQKEQGYSLWTGVKNTAAEVANPEHLAIDAAVMGTAYLGGWAIGAAAPKLMTPFAQKIETSAISGAARGAISELTAARLSGEQVNWGRVGAKSLATSIVYGFAAAPGAWYSDYQAHQQAQQKIDQIQHQHDGAGDGNYLTYKKAGQVKAEQLTQDLTWKSTNGDTLTGNAGDWKLTGPDGSTWTVKPDIFAKTYGEVTPGSGIYEKTALARAMKLKVDYSVQSLEGASSGKAGDYLIMGPNNEFYIVNAAKFEGMYTQVQQPAKN
ncbi:MAG: PGDYG domain-containing protein [Candidatus Obscuribacterales bacterium]|nr:PGDYG domain-containing protein [Candidatus Obscuribacterales bacterium]